MKALKWIGAVIAALVGITAAGVSLAVWMGERKLQRSVDIRVVPVPFARDAASARLGRYLFESRGCSECHGANGAGRVMIDDASGLLVRTPNITTGGNGVASYGEADWVRAIRHGVNPAGHALLIMPSDDYNRLSDSDLAALVSYVRSLPPAAGEPALIRLPLHMKALYGVGLMKDASEKIDHRKAPPPAVPIAENAEYGAYVANMCVGCHGIDLSGGPIAGSPPDWPPAANLTTGNGSVMVRYPTPDAFVAMMRSGKRPDGSAVSRVMPFATLAKMNDTDLRAIYAYLKTLAAGPQVPR